MSSNNKPTQIQKLTATYRKAFTEWGESTTSHGIPNIVRANRTIIRIMWIIFFLAAAGYCLYTIIQSIIQYYNYETYIELNSVYDTPTEFPAISFCNLNAYNFFSNFTFFFTILTKYNLSHGIDNSQFGKTDRTEDLVRGFYAKLNRAIAVETLGDDRLRRSIGYDISDMLLSCTFNKKPCDINDFSYYWSNEYGNCFTFNGGKYTNGTLRPILYTSAASAEYGLQLELLTGNPTQSYSYFVQRDGLYLAIHNSSFPANLVSNGINVAAGLETYVSVTRTFYNYLSKPYSDCIQTIEEFRPINAYSRVLYEYMIEENVTDYNQDLCYRLCFQDQLADACDCCDINIPVIKNKSYCVSDSQLDCLYKMNEKFSTENMDTLCQYACPNQCNSIRFDISDHSSTYPSDFYYYKLINALTTTKNIKYPASFQYLNDSWYQIFRGRRRFVIIPIIRQNMLKIIVNYDDLTYTVVEENPSLTVETLFGILGGQLGLFIGISFLSFVEILELIIRIVYLYRTNKAIKEAAQNAFKQNYMPSYATAFAPTYGNYRPY